MNRAEIAIIGAGISGLAAAQTLTAAGFALILFEQAAEVGGRATSRSCEGFTYDYGAQYIKGGSLLSHAWITERFCAPDLINISKPVWTFDAAGQIQEGDPQQNAEPKWNYRSGLLTLAKRIAQGLDIRLETGIDHVEQIESGWNLFDTAGHRFGPFARLLITIPAPQALQLIEQSHFAGNLQETIRIYLSQVHYNPLISVMLGYRPTPRERPYYALVNSDKAHPISWLAWEHEKSPERVPVHAGLLLAQMAPQYSREHWATPDDELIEDVAQLVSKLTGEPLGQPFFSDIYRWPYALPIEKADARQLNSLTLPEGLAFCGDAFVGGRVHLALEHGVEVAYLF